MKHKLLTVLLTLIATLCLCFALAACDNGRKDNGTTGNGSTTEQGGNTQHVHSFTDYVYNNDATCTEDGTETATCTCGATDTRTKTGTAGHSYTAENLCSECGDQWKFTEGLIYELDSDTDTYTVTNIGTASGDIVIPYGYQDKMVTKIGDGAFENSNSTVTSITIPASVTSIGYWAFRDRSDLTSITIPDGVTLIGVSAFWGCSGLTSIEIPDSVTSIGEYAFWDCSGLSTIVWNAENCTKAGSSSYPIFKGCTSLKTVTFGENVKTIPAYAFFGCSGLTGELKIPDSVTSIGNLAFKDCSGLTGVYITDLTAWCRIDFEGSNSNPLNYAHHLDVDNVELTELTIPNEITEIKPYAFTGCDGLTSITIPDSVTSIGDMAFYNCDGLTSIEIPDSVTSIGWYTFYDCSSLISIEIPSSVTSIGGYAFSDTAYSKDQSHWDESGVLYIGNHLLEAKNTILGSYTIRADTKTIAGGAFSGCSSLTSIEIPDSVTSIEWKAFYGCSLLESIVIPDGVTSIGEYTFYGCSGLKSVTIVSGVTLIGSYAFDGCSGLENVYYKGTPSEWSGIKIGIYNYSLTGATRYYFSAQKPSAEQWQESENWWHYDLDTNEPTPWVKENQ